jgi:hypothetical protein
VCDDEDEDWAILKVTIGSLTHFVTVCSEPELPGKHEVVIINDFPVGLIDSFNRQPFKSYLTMPSFL